MSAYQFSPNTSVLMTSEKSNAVVAAVTIIIEATKQSCYFSKPALVINTGVPPDLVLVMVQVVTQSAKIGHHSSAEVTLGCLVAFLRKATA